MIGGHSGIRWKVFIHGLVQDYSNSIVNALVLLQSCTKPSVCTVKSSIWDAA